MDWGGNTERIIKAIDEADAAGVDIVCLPELCITGYGCEDAFLSSATLNKANECLFKIMYHSRDMGMAVIVGMPVYNNGAIYNCAVVLAHGKIVGVVPKQNLASDGIHYESRWFKPWTKDASAVVSIGSFRPNFGDISFYIENRDITFGFEICEDAWVASRPGIELSSRGTDLIFNPSASHFAFGKSKTREGFVEEGSRAFNCAYVYTNLLGNESGRAIYDGDTIIAECGNILASGPRLSFKDHILTVADINFSKIKNKKIASASFKPNYDYNYSMKHINIQNTNTKNNFVNELKQNFSKFEEFEAAATLGLFDYMRKSHSKGFVLSLSGGADSSAMATLIHKTVSNGIKELGIETFKTKSGFHTAGKDAQEITNEWLTCMYQSTNNSSDETELSAKTLANILGAKFYSISINDIVNKYTNEIETCIGRKLTWETDDITLQNIQARVRSPSIWMLANINNALLLSTSNRSEAAVGYATMDGDTSGGLSPLAGIDKEFLLKWLLHLKNEPFYAEALKNYYSLIPTAELRPQDQNQSDETDLMPYSILNRIEKLAIRDKFGVKDIYETLLLDGVSAGKALTYVEKFFRLWARNQWKRERYAVSFHYDDENLDPRSWCRWPILSAGFEEELTELKMSLVKEIIT